MTHFDGHVWICDALSGIVMLGGGASSSPAPQETTTTSSPWAPQQPYLTEGFQGAQNLYNGSGPAYYPGSTYAGYTPDQFSAIGQVPSVASSNMNGIDTNASNFENNLLTGGYLNSNPSTPGLTSLGYNNGGISTLGAIQSGYGLGQGTLEGFAGGNPSLSLPGMGTLSDLSTTNSAINPFTGMLGGIASGNNGFESDLGAIASPSSMGAISQSVLSNVVPQIQSQFINGGDLASPSAAYATSSGATSALAPYALNQEQIQEGAANAGLGAQESAANAGSGNLIEGGAIQGQIANELAAEGMGGLGLSENAASTLGSQALGAGSTGANLQEGALSNLGSLYNQGVGQELQGTAFAPTVQSMPYTDLSNLFGAGSSEQTNNQDALNADVNQWNYYQTLPYQMLNQYQGEVTGNYGGTVTQPYFATSPTSNAIGGALSGASAGAGIGSALFGAGTGGAMGGAGLGALAGLMFL
jgi:hypothetical protein